MRLLLLHVLSSLLLQHSNRRKRRMLECLSNLQNVIPPKNNISTGSHLYSGQLLIRWSKSRVESQTSVRLFGYFRTEMHSLSSSPISGSVNGKTRHSQTRLFGLRKPCGMFSRNTSQVVIKLATMYLWVPPFAISGAIINYVDRRDTLIYYLISRSPWPHFVHPLSILTSHQSGVSWWGLLHQELHRSLRSLSPEKFMAATFGITSIVENPLCRNSFRK